MDIKLIDEIEYKLRDEALRIDLGIKGEIQDRIDAVFNTYDIMLNRNTDLKNELYKMGSALEKLIVMKDKERDEINIWRKAVDVLEECNRHWETISKISFLNHSVEGD